LKYLEILKANKELQSKFNSRLYKIKILSNISISQIKELLEYSLRVEGINAELTIGDYDNIVQESQNCQDSDLVIVFWELCNIIDGFQYKVELFNEEQLDDIFNKIRSEIDFVWQNLNTKSLLIFNKFSGIHFSSSGIQQNQLERLSKRLNHYIEKNITTNAIVVDIEKIVSISGLSESVSLPYFYTSKALYSLNFLKSYVDTIKHAVLSANGKIKKILVFDCDNTLWKGILGEDGFSNIGISLEDKSQAVFAEVQSIGLALNNAGILIGLCSKNNPEDVEKVLDSHPDMILKNKNISIKKINWKDKVVNLKSMAQELNISLDSFVFVDDSAFEINLINAQLPEVTTVHVPENIFEYPKLLRDNICLFFNHSYTDEDAQKIAMYQQQIKRTSVQKKFKNLEGYLASLQLKISVHKDKNSIIPRMAQLTQKTNQFNLTTKRYTNTRLNQFVASAFSKVIAFSVSDKFGNNGITGLVIINIEQNNKVAMIDTFLMSCRIIGRNIEHAFFDFLITELNNTGIKRINAMYIETQKNKQVSDFYKQKGFSRIEEDNSLTDNAILYKININDYTYSNIKYIELNET